MTVAVAVVDREAGVVHLATDGWDQDLAGVHIDVHKLWTPCPGVVVAVAGRARTVPLLRAHVPLEPPGTRATEDDLDLWAHDFAERATTELTARGCVEHGPDAQEGEYDGQMLLATGRHLWEVTGWTAARIVRRYHAIGSGTEAALGALWVMAHEAGVGVPVAARPGRAVEAAVAHLSGLGGPVALAST